MNSKRQTLLAVLSMAGFVALWAMVTDAWNYSALLLGNLPAGKYLYGYFSRIVWMFPAFLCIRRFDKHLFWRRKQLFSKPKAEPVFILFMALTTMYALVSMWINYHSWHVTDENFLLLTIKLFIVGVGEETVFRGWGYNLLKKVHSDKISLILSTFLFVILHWPAYFIKLILHGNFNCSGFLVQSVSALFCGLLFAVMLRRSKTLWNPMIAHFYYDWMLEMFV